VVIPNAVHAPDDPRSTPRQPEFAASIRSFIRAQSAPESH
jgi:hypothetical protein